MIDLSKITPEELDKKIDEMPATAEAVINSDALEQKIADISNRYNLIQDEEINEPYALKQLIVLLALDIIKRDELAEAIETYLYRSEDESKTITQEILSIISSQLPISPVGSLQIKPAPQPPTTPENIQSTAAPRAANVIKPVEIRTDMKPVEEIKINQRPVNANSPEVPAPFIIHEHKESAALNQDLPTKLGQTFIKPQFGGAPTRPIDQMPTAKVDFGRGLYNLSKPQNPNPSTERRVDYSAPKIPAEPPKPNNENEKSIELKDLPK